MIIPDEVKESIRERVDLGALIGEYVRLQKSGASLKGRCPFHDEKSPSFYVHPHRGFFKCFGCDAKGDVFSFLMRMEGLGFGEAARRLAERAGVELPTSDPREDEAYRRKRQRQERLLAITEAAAGFYRDQLGAHPLGEIARQAIAERGVLEATAETFRLGYAPHGWDGLTRFLERGGWSPREAEEVGLIVPRRGRSGHYDRFRHRLMFTITDHRGRIVAFSGRVLPPPPGEEEDAKGGKYINSPETPLYTKGEVLFGLHEGRVDIRRRGWVLLCEGNFDLLMLHQAGFAKKEDIDAEQSEAT
ncbi:MAG: DNA primase, partial [Myxococcota bacterium]